MPRPTHVKVGDINGPWAMVCNSNGVPIEDVFEVNTEEGWPTQYINIERGRELREVKGQFTLVLLRDAPQALKDEWNA